ncbi:transglycosylase SLT domain-containing protein [Paenalkalicoccus suaedae]|uniref:Transglycosylase SLT domain-containing protein n=1 Tax=Paenalkalicoccus suaedae TaxID=2592382 RepID=A0A859FF88_9BACI|nr:transglycosylase SLT domain-containing protein [Paenalkalicoccus suaedae]QKS70885.1 transglycosylase SLT domain-containing protein [Paenalkalicoccus suaedae]
MKISFLTMLTVTAVMGALSLVLGNGYMETQKEIERLEVAKAEERPEIDPYVLELDEHIDKLPDGYIVSGNVNFQEAKVLADALYEESDGNFKYDWGLLLSLEAQKRDIDPHVVYELLRVETGDTFDPSLVGPETRYGHAYGMAQFMKNTGPWVAEMAELPYKHEYLFDPHYAIQLSVTYLEYLYGEYGDWDHALTAYHRGMGGLNQYIRENGHARSWYAEEIQEKAEALVTFVDDQN